MPHALRSLATVNNRSPSPFRPVAALLTSLRSCDVVQFRQRAFQPELPLLITTADELDAANGPPSALPALDKWFARGRGRAASCWDIKHDFLQTYSSTWLPYEYTTPSASPSHSEHQLLAGFGYGLSSFESHNRFAVELQKETSDVLKQTPLARTLGAQDIEPHFHSFNAPLALFLLACKWRSQQDNGALPNLYIAQAQLQDLPQQLRDDLPTPHLVLEAEKGDVYDANIWLGTPPTYTPLHKDPNPNLFVQLAGRKVVRLYDTRRGRAIYNDVMQKLASSRDGSTDSCSASMGIRGDEMMKGMEKRLFHEAVWGDTEDKLDRVVCDGFEASLGPGDALFIPKGWWHSIKSVGDGVSASVNWWFR